MPQETITTLTHDQSERKIHAATWQDVEDIIDRNKALQSEHQSADWMRHVGTVPNVIILSWLYEEHAKGNTSLKYLSPEFDRIIAKKLKDPDWSLLRTDSSMANFKVGYRAA